MRLLLLALFVGLAGCTAPTPAPEGPRDLTCPTEFPESTVEARGTGDVTLLTYSSFGLTEEDLAAFTEATGYTARIVHAGDAGEALTKAIVTKDAPVADALFGVDDTLVARARAADLFAPYASPHLAHVERSLLEPFCADGGVLATPLDHGYVMLNHDPAWFEARGVPLPTDLAQLAEPAYAPLTVVQNPFTSSPGMAFFLATVDRFGEDGFEDFWRAFVANGGKIAADWDGAYGRDFTQGYDATGTHDRPIVVSYSTSPAFNPMNGYGDATSATLDLPGAAWHQVEALGILKGAKNEAGARALADWLLTPEAQATLAFRQVTYPVRADAEIPEAYAAHAPEPADPARIPAEDIDANRERWLDRWRDAVGQ